jgi:hypothetical protein
MARVPKHLKRATPKTKATNDKILIVCEGEKTEPNYFKEIRSKYKLTSAIVVDGNCDSSPDQVFKYAQQKALEEARTGSPFDKVYCVMDKDNHEHFTSTVEAIGAKKGSIFESSDSIPSFEYWLLLHFTYSRKSYVSQKNNSVGRQVIKDLKQYPGMENYDKGEETVFSTLGEKKLATAITNAEKIITASELDGSNDPSTKVHLLIKHLQKMRDFQNC